MKRKRMITVGTFDGMHLGHRALFTHLEQMALRYQLKPLVLYFPYPAKTLLSPAPAMTVLSTPPEKKRLLKEIACGIECQELNFQIYREFLPEHFFRKVLVEKYHCGGILAGPDFTFGKNRQGNAALLKQRCAQLGLPCEIMPFYQAPDGAKISSSLIRKIMAEGNIAQANNLLGYVYSAQGRVMKGHQLGRKLGYPTANLDINYYKLLPLGVYAVRVRLGRSWYKGICNIGYRPTVNTITAPVPLTEVHILNFNQSIYGRRMEIQFIGKIRGEVKFDSLDELKAQLAQDKQAAQSISF